MATIERGHRTLARDLGISEHLAADLLKLLRPLEAKGKPLVCIDCYRDGGCRECSRPEGEGQR